MHIVEQVADKTPRHACQRGAVGRRRRGFSPSRGRLRRRWITRQSAGPLHGESLDLLQLPFVEEAEGLLGEALNNAALLVPHHHRHHHQVDVRRERGFFFAGADLRLVLRRCGSVRRLSGASCRGQTRRYRQAHKTYARLGIFGHRSFSENSTLSRSAGGLRRRCPAITCRTLRPAVREDPRPPAPACHR